MFQCVPVCFNDEEDFVLMYNFVVLHRVLRIVVRYDVYHSGFGVWCCAMVRDAAWCCVVLNGSTN